MREKEVGRRRRRKNEKVGGEMRRIDFFYKYDPSRFTINRAACRKT